MSDPRDILTPDEARQFLGRGLQDSNLAEILELAITATSRKLDESIGPVVTGGTVGTITGELHSGGGTCVWLDDAPLVSVVQVVEYDGTTAGTLTAETNSSKPDAAYHIDTTSGKLLRRSGGGTTYFPCGLDNIYVTYVRGRYATTADVDPRYKFGAGMMLKANWRMFESAAATMGEFDVPHASFPSFSVPKAVKEFFGAEWRTGQGV